MNFATWNVQDIKQKINIIASDLEKMNLDVVALMETKNKGNGTSTVNMFIYLLGFLRIKEPEEFRY